MVKVNVFSTKKFLSTLVTLLILQASFYANAAQWPEGSSFVGLKDGEWQLYVVAKGRDEPEYIETSSEPRTPSFHPHTGKIAYIAADGKLRELSIDGNQDRVLLRPTKKQAYTQPAYDSPGKYLYVVALKEGASVDTNILRLDPSRKKVKPVVVQRSAQFEPLATASNHLFYSNVLCTIGCGKIIQEIWRMDLVSGDAKQLTMINSIARQPTLSPTGDWLYFSSNKSGYFHIWRLHLAEQNYEEITQGNVTDINPALDKEGNLYFIRRSPQGTKLLQLNTEGLLTIMKLPEGISDLRDLEIQK